MQENRTIDNLFQGYPNADTTGCGEMGSHRVKLHQVSLNSADLDNSYNSSTHDFDGGKMDGFPKMASGFVNRSDIMVEQTYGLPTLGSVAEGYSDARATSMLDAFDFTKKPRAFRQIPAPVFPDFFLHMKPSGRVPDN